ncbi:hypothetical protein [Bacillus sp. USDA818B3_A]|uniref:hypothetical protein n=1 Tax=Bacillus sp. USDA818B3_A TaxID=2698834 RepID=UPI00136EDDAC|nr:hypothetical protein [Bacillus sp. USDA818B3_A]
MHDKKVLADYSNNMKKIRWVEEFKMNNQVNFFVFILLLVKVVFSKKQNIGW